jgi:hypothetical protein
LPFATSVKSDLFIYLFAISHDNELAPFVADYVIYIQGADPGGSIEFMNECTTIDNPFCLYDAEQHKDTNR